MPLSTSELKEILDSVANALLHERGFIPSFPQSAIHEIQSLTKPRRSIDCTNRFWISIDNQHSQDLDQITSIEPLDHHRYRLYVAISDVASFIPIDSEVDQIARHNTSSIYTPFKIFPMLPEKYAYGLTSLLPHEVRSAVVSEIIIESDGSYQLDQIYLADVKNHAKLVYEEVSAWIDSGYQLTGSAWQTDQVHNQLKLHHQVAQKIAKYRMKKGALNFLLVQGEVIVEEGLPLGIREKTQTTGHAIIENIMIASNVCTTKYFLHHQLPVLLRVVKTPKRWEKIVEIAAEKGFKLPKKPDQKSLQNFLTHQQKVDPVHFHDLSLTVIKLIGRGEYVLSHPKKVNPGHFDLALIDYAHTTAPNRRYPDLMMQRILYSHLFTDQVRPPTSVLLDVARNCTQQEEAKDKIERHLYKSFAAHVLSGEIHRSFKAIVTGSGEKGTWVRLLELPVEGKLIKGYETVDIGDHLIVRLCHVDIAKGFIDFCNLGDKHETFSP